MKRRVKIVQHEVDSNAKLDFFSIHIDGSKTTEAEKWIEQFPEGCKYDDDIDVILCRMELMKQIGYNFGDLREEGGGVYRLPSLDDKKENGRSPEVRLYCIPIGDRILILGNGGIKPYNRPKLSDNPELEKHVNLLRQLNHELQQSLKLKKTYFKHGDIHGITEFEIED